MHSASRVWSPHGVASVAGLLLLSLIGCDAHHATAPAPARATFRGLGIGYQAVAVSGDGRVIIGDAPGKGFISTDGGTARIIGNTPYALTADGAVVVGAAGSQAVRWTTATGWVGVSDIDTGSVGTEALGISPDGAAIVGFGVRNGAAHATRWISGQPFVLGEPNGVVSSYAMCASAGGASVAGYMNLVDHAEAFVWSEATGMIGLGAPPGGELGSFSIAMTPDASVIVGEVTTANGTEAFRWTRDGGKRALGHLHAGSAADGRAFSVSADGSVVVGYDNEIGAEAFIWDPAHGMRSLKAVLLAMGVTEVEGWTLWMATGVSADGRTIVGKGTDPLGNGEGWMARLP